LSDYDAIVERVSDSPLALAKVARSLLLPGEAARARALCGQALAQAPDDGEVQALHDEVFSAGVGDWYFGMVRDEIRYAAMDRVLRRALSGGGRVLEIGAGVGLLAMMAARAGADEVITCERDGAVADAARAVVARNGLQDRVTVVAKNSLELAIGDDMPGLADVLVWDNVGNNLIGAGALPAIEDATRRLLKPGGAVIPARGTIKAALAEDSKLDRHRMGTVQGFDLSTFNKLAKPGYAIDPESRRLTLRSSAASLFAFDFASGGPFRAERVAREVAGLGGHANGVVQWLEFDLDEHEGYQTAPGARSCAFGLVFRPTKSIFEATAGAAFAIGASHDRAALWVWLQGAP
jgi:protein arginine N-methyltransferase 7